MADLEPRFGFSAKRRSLIENLRCVAEELIGMGVGEIYMNGSFTTHKISPGDVDAYVLVLSDSPLYEQIAERQEAWKIQQGIDLSPAATDLEGYGSQAYYEQLFGWTSEATPRPKGIVKLSLRR